ncbi:MAG: 4Fe-4S binding protein [Clostridiales Family XIII bacterium]|nr:4Fe-4S binding protein [Clostridiales Family XIII bacterium]
MKTQRKQLNGLSTVHIWTNTRKCTACWRCVKVCPKHIIVKAGGLWHKHIAIENPGECIGCKKCIKACPHGVFSEK